MIAVFIDVETTGLDIYRDRLLEIGLIVVDLTQNKVVNTYEALILGPGPLEVTSGHHINQITTDEMIDRGKTEEQVAYEIEAILVEHAVFMHHGFFICQNPVFDYTFTRPLFGYMRTSIRAWPYHWLDLASMFWIKLGCFSEYPVKLSKNNIARRLNLDSEAEPHRALYGALHLLECYNELVRME